MILDLDETVADHETRLTAAEENIQGSSVMIHFPSVSSICKKICSGYFYEPISCTGLQMTDVELDGRVTALEQNAGGSGQNGNAFQFFRVSTIMT